jgi:RNase adaptor protein for sRNA GlmZ degradation
MHPVKIYSFGYLHDRPAVLDTADITLDLRRLLADPAHVPGGDMLDLTGLDMTVRRFVRATPGALALVDHTRALVLALAAVKPVVVVKGCAGGRHRSVSAAQDLHDQLTAAGVPVLVQHLHVHLPRVIK